MRLLRIFADIPPYSQSRSNDLNFVMHLSSAVCTTVSVTKVRVAVIVLCLLYAVPWASLWSVIVAVSGHTGCPKHMKRFEILITFDPTKVCCLLFLLINILYIEII